MAKKESSRTRLYRVTSGKHRRGATKTETDDRGKVTKPGKPYTLYVKGDTLELTDREARDMESYVELVVDALEEEAPPDESPDPSEGTETDWSSVLAHNVDGVGEIVAGILEAEDLATLRAAEVGGGNRSGVLKAIDARGKKLQESSEE